MIKYIGLAVCFLLAAVVINYSSAQSLNFNWSTAKGTEGFFRVVKTTEGQWWFVTATNQPFYYKGVCAVNRAGTAGGRRAMPGKYAVTVDKKYNYQQSPDAFVQASIEKLRMLGFNALGAWATEEFYNKGMPFTEIIEFFKEPPFLPATTRQQGLPDIFDTAWLINADRKVRALCTPLRYSKDLVGYFTDNEIGFGKTDDGGFDLGFEAGQFDFSLLRTVLGMDSSKAACKAAWAFLLKRYNDSFAQLSAAWGLAVDSRAAIGKLNQARTAISSKQYEADAAAFSSWYASTYFQVAQQLIRRYDPNHLILGCRFGAPPPTYVLDAILPYTDVISVNNYRPTLYERYDTVFRYTQLPILVGEISWNTDLFKYIPFASETTSPLTVKERMFTTGTTTLQHAALHDGIVGFTWYRWVQGISTDDRFCDGVVNYNDDLDIHKEAQQTVLRTLDTLRISANGGNWKNAGINNGEMTLFFDSLRAGWNQPLRMELVAGKAVSPVYGWKMKGSVIKYVLSKGMLDINLKIDFEALSNNTRPIPGGTGLYTIHMIRDGEKWTGNYRGHYNGTVIAGKVHAFYFPRLNRL